MTADKKEYALSFPTQRDYLREQFLEKIFFGTFGFPALELIKNKMLSFLFFCFFLEKVISVHITPLIRRAASSVHKKL